MKRKTHIVLTVLFLMLAYQLSGQKMEYGIIGGMDVSAFRMSNTPSEKIGTSWVYNPLVGFNVNASAEYKNETWGLSIEPGFIQKGGVQLFGYANFLSRYTTNYHVETRLNYLQLPLLYNIYLSDIFCLSVGGEYSYLIHSDSKLTKTPNSIDKTLVAFDSTQDQFNSKYITNNFPNHHELSGIIGISYALTDEVDVRLRYSYGATELATVSWMDQSGFIYSASHIRNHYLQVSLKYKLFY